MMNGHIPSSTTQHTISAALADTEEIDGYRVGRMESVPPPQELYTRFRLVREQLSHQLVQATTTTKIIGTSLTDIMLCMAAKCDSLQQTGSTIRLKPTVWIQCENPQLRKVVAKAIKGSKVLQNFISREHLEKPHVSLNAPNLWVLNAMSGQRTGRPHTGSLEIQDGVSSLNTICGARAKFLVQTQNRAVTCYSTIGGLVVVRDRLFAMTTAHAIVNAVSDAQLTVSEPLGESHTLKWEASPFPKTYSYVRDAFVDGVRLARGAHCAAAADFALIDPASLASLSNRYQTEDSENIETVADHIPTSELFAGDVWVVTSRDGHPAKGYMVQGDASIIMEGGFIHTKMVKFTANVGRGLSGAWVVREGKLCGVVCAGNTSRSYLHMIPAETMLKDVKRVVESDTVRVATAQDISEYEARRRSRRSKDQDVFASTLSRERHSAVLTEHLSESSRSERASADEPAHSRPTYTDDVYWRPSPETPRARETFLSPEYLPYGITVASQGRGDFEQGRGDFEQGRGDFEQDRGDFEYGRGDRSKTDDESPADEAKSSAAYDLQFGTGRYF